MNKKKIQKFIIVILVIATIALLAYFFKDFIFDLLKYERENNNEAIKDLIESKGILGPIMISFIEAMQMIVVVISAEFIQVAAGICYPWWLAWILCEIGVFIGASIIFLLVRLLKFDGKIFAKSSNKIEDIANRKKKNRNIQSLMYILFFMPVIPFGAICYFGSNSKISYRRYIITCVSGVIPSILSSLLLSTFLKMFISLGISIVWLILIIIALMILLFSLMLILINKIYFKEDEKTPNSTYYTILKKLFTLFVPKKVYCDRGDIDKITGPYLIMSNHASFFDIYYVDKVMKSRRAVPILNKFYFRNRFLRFILTQIGVIPKSLFYPDIQTITSTYKAVNNGFPIMMCPEGRLSLDGTTYDVTESTGKLIQKLNIPVVLVRIEGAYLNKPKWRKKILKNAVSTKVIRILYPEQYQNMTVDQIDNIINKSIKYNDFAYARKTKQVYKYKKKAEGLEKILYHCPHCHEEFELTTKGNDITCKHCGFTLHINENYSFDANKLQIKDISDWYQRICNYESKLLSNSDYILETQVKVKQFDMKNFKKDHKGNGYCRLTNQVFEFKGTVNGGNVEFSIPVKQLRALPFAVGLQFECYYKNDLYYFYPTTNPNQVVKWSLIVDELNKK